ncbi:MAG: ATP-dependent Clp protease adaptor ClpS [Flavobacteriales bacterium]|nr:ATP-dependent Clp protease adaptor ClpS [Flavobacteriales bacterium]
MNLDPLFSLDLEVEFQQELDQLVQAPKTLVIHNDDYNTFDFVIETLIEYCGHEPLQAEQCTFIIHYSGKCAVKTDMFSKLQPVWARIINLGLTATIEDIPKIAK